MSQPVAAETLLRVLRLPGLGGLGVWMVCRSGPELPPMTVVEEWRAAAERTMDGHAEVATVSIVAGTAHLTAGEIVQAPAALLPLAFFSGKAADLLGFREADDQSHFSNARFEQLVAAVTRKGLVHCWLAVEPSTLSAAGLASADSIPPAAAAKVFRRTDLAVGEARRAGIVVGIDAAWLGSSESGAQVAALEMVRELVTRAEIDRVVLISDAGQVSGLFDGVPKVSGLSWQDALANDGPVVDLLHRPYQPDMNMDYGRYHRVSHCVALTVLDLIAYDNPMYHESDWSWRRYQEIFDENVCLADCVFAISRHVADRLEHQLAHQLPGPVRSIPLGTDHLLGLAEEPAVAPPPDVQALAGTPFLLVLGNDFEHKNRDFAVRVFADMRNRGYEGRLVMAGFHLDGGSTFHHELSGAASHADAIVRMGSVSPAAKRWLLRHAEVVLYPTSSEGFGLVPFEAAALGTPSAFVAFGPLREMLAGVDACAGWQVRLFADHVFQLRANPATQLGQIRAAGAALTWASHADRVLEGYRQALDAREPWRTRRRAVPGPAIRFRRAVASLQYRAQNKLRRLTGRES